MESPFWTGEESATTRWTHAGPFADEPRTLAVMDRFMSDAGLVHNGMHHEIYLTDLQHTPPEQARTILRQPVKVA